MEQIQDYRRIVFRMSEASRPQKKRLPRFRESFDTMILGTLSTSVGVVVLMIGLVKVSGIGLAEWHDLVREMPLPILGFGIASIIGEALGLAGLVVGRVRWGMISPLSAVGTIVCLGQMYLLFGNFLVMGLI